MLIENCGVKNFLEERDSDYRRLDNLFPGLLAVFTNYEDTEGGGSGSALGYMDNGHVLSWNLGHCSCYGPWDEVTMPDVYKTAEEYFKKRGALEFGPEEKALRRWLSRREAEPNDPDFGEDLWAYRDWLEERGRGSEALAIDALIGGN